MPKLPALTAKTVEKLILREGYLFDHSKGSHRVYYNPANKKRVVIPFRRKDLPKGTLLSILRQANLSKDDLVY